jgi:hypothetical protein
MAPPFGEADSAGTSEADVNDPKRTSLKRYMLAARAIKEHRVIAMLETDKLFAGSVPDNYDRYMVPLIFEPYAADLAQRAASLSPSAVLEIAAGTGVVTRVGAKTLS